MDANAIYYTLSTIAQTLAGALAILVAVALFKLAALQQVIEESTGTFAVTGKPSCDGARGAPSPHPGAPDPDPPAGAGAVPAAPRSPGSSRI